MKDNLLKPNQLTVMQKIYHKDRAQDTVTATIFPRYLLCAFLQEQLIPQHKFTS